jgi:hypothetical protein
VTTPIDSGTPGTPVRPKSWFFVGVVGVYLVLGALAYWPVLPGISGRVFGLDGDFTQSVWFISWVPHALAHGLNPFFSNAMYAPVGVNLAQNTASPFLGLLTTPLTVALSPLVIGNLLLALAMPVSATAAFVVLRKWDVWGPAAAFGGLIYGFSPYMVGQGLGHPELMVLPLPPFIALTVVSIVQGRGRPWRLGMWLGLLVAAQFLISPEVLAVVLILTLLGVFYTALRHPRSAPTMARTMGRPVALAFGIAAVLLAYPVWMLVAGPEHFAGPTVPLLNPYYNDGLSFVVHGTLQRVSFGMPVSWSGTLSSYQPTESGGYIGIPVLIISGYLAWRSRRSDRVQLTVALLLTSALLSLGPYLYLHGRPTGIPLPFLVLSHLPLINNVLPSRISFEMDACLAALIAFGIDDLRRLPNPGRSSRRLRERRVGGTPAGAILVVAVVALVVTQLPVWPYQMPTAAGLPTGVRRAIPSGDPMAITYPYTNYPYLEPMIWQADSGFAFRMLGGYARHSNAHGNGAGSSPMALEPPGLQQFLLRQQFLADPLVNPFVSVSSYPAPTGSALIATTRATLIRYHVRLIIVDHSMRESGPVMQLFEAILGPPRLVVGQYSVWAQKHDLTEQS